MTAEARTIPVELGPELVTGLAVLVELEGLDEEDVMRRALADRLRMRSGRPSLVRGRLLDGAETGR